MTREGVLLIAIGLAAFGWDLFDDPARAAYVLQALLTLVALVLLAWPPAQQQHASPRAAARARRGQHLLAAIALTGAGLEAITIACGVWFEALSSQAAGVCDEGTGRPIRAALGVAVLVGAARLLKGLRDDARR